MVFPFLKWYFWPSFCCTNNFECIIIHSFHKLSHQTLTTRVSCARKCAREKTKKRFPKWLKISLWLVNTPSNTLFIRATSITTSQCALINSYVYWNTNDVRCLPSGPGPTWLHFEMEMRKQKKRNVWNNFAMQWTRFACVIEIVWHF